MERPENKDVHKYLLYIGNELSMNISQVKKLRKIVRIKKLATKNNKIFVCTMKKTSVHDMMVLTIIPCLLFLCPICKKGRTMGQNL